MGALVQFGLIMSLPIVHMSVAEWETLASLTAMLVATVWSAIWLRRQPQRSVTILIVGTIYSAYLIARIALAIRYRVTSVQAALTPAQVISVVLALGTLAIMPIALAIAWPLRIGAPKLLAES
jgi:hypothetical protein